MRLFGTVIALFFLAGCTANARQNAALWGMVAVTAAAAHEIAAEDAAAEEDDAGVCFDCSYHHAHACEHGW